MINNTASAAPTDPPIIAARLLPSERFDSEGIVGELLDMGGLLAQPTNEDVVFVVEAKLEELEREVRVCEGRTAEVTVPEEVEEAVDEADSVRKNCKASLEKTAGSMGSLTCSHKAGRDPP